MPIRVKEIFNTDLDPNSDNWWAKDKVDKLNFNFNQFIQGGAPGPFGKDGADGETGEMGFQGLEGSQGPFGAQGFEGFPGESYWKKLEGANNDTLFPFPLTSDPELGAIPTIIGAPADNLSLYDEVIDWSASVLNINSLIDSQTGLNKSNLTFTTEDDNGQILPVRSIIKLYANPINGSDTLYFGKSNEFDPNKLELSIDATTVDYTNYKVRIDAGGDTYPDALNITHESAGERFFKSHVHTTLSENNQVKGDFVYSKVPIDGGILVSTDVDGNVEWKNRGEYFGALPQGSIVAIPQEFFNDNNFDLDPGFTVNENTGVLEFTYGRGKQNGDFKGWYICNGATWQQDGLVTFEVPNLNSAGYNIDTQSFSTGQEDAASAVSNRVLIASSGVTTTGVFDADAGSYDITLETETTDIDYTPTPITNSGVATINNQVKIINLVEQSLHWETGDINAINPDPINLSTGSLTSDACSASHSAYEWTGGTDLSIWSDFNNNLTGVQLYVNNSGVYASAPTGWYQLFEGSPLSGTGFLRYWNGSSFTNTDTCPLQVTINLAYNSSVINLNGQQSSGTDYIINASNFNDATELKTNSGAIPDSGWYKPVGSGAKYRRYWYYDENSGVNEFRGDSIIETYVYRFTGNTHGSRYETNNACNNKSLPFPAYFATNNLTASLTLSTAASSQSKVYVHLDWLGSTQGAYPLIGIADQNRPSGSSPYLTLLQEMIDLKRSTITQQSRVNQPDECTSPNNFEIDNQEYFTYTILPEDNAVSISGEFNVNNAPATITLQASASPGAQNEVDATINISNLGNGAVGAIDGGFDSTTFSATSTGTYTFNIYSILFTGPNAGQITLSITP